MRGAPLLPRVVIALLVSWPLLAARAADPADGRSPQDLATEKMLSEAAVVAIDDIGEGVTHPHRLTLKEGDREIHAVFKTVEIDRLGYDGSPTKELHFSDKYQYEIAAYRLDRLLGLRVVPPTVIRKVNGTTGSVQLWIEHAETYEKRRKEHGNFALRCGEMNVLDGLIYNIDRNTGNVLFTEDGGLYLIDHSRAFRDDRRLSPFVKDWSVPVSPAIVARLRAITFDDLKRVIGPYLDARQVKAVESRRKQLVDKLGAVATAR